MADTIRTRAALVTLLADNETGDISPQDLRDFLISTILRGDYDADFIFGSPQMDDDEDTDHDTRMFFDKSKGAFRVGRVTGAQWDAANVGDYSVAEGTNTTSSGEGSHAEGDTTIASGDFSHSEGVETIASGENSHAEGYTTTASGDYSHAEGTVSTASGTYSHAEGIYSNARLESQHAHANGRFAALGDCQNTKYQLRCATTNNTKTELTSPARFTLEDEHSYACTVTIHGRQDTGANHAMYKRMVIIERTGGTVALAGSMQTIGTDIETNADWDVDLTADDTNKSLKVEVTGDTSENIRWTALIETVELGYSD